MIYKYAKKLNILLSRSCIRETGLTPRLIRMKISQQRRRRHVIIFVQQVVANDNAKGRCIVASAVAIFRSRDGRMAEKPREKNANLATRAAQQVATQIFKANLAVRQAVIALLIISGLSDRADKNKELNRMP